MGFLSGKKKVDTERGMLEIRGTMNAMTLRIRKLETRMMDEEKLAREALRRGDKAAARSHLAIVADLENRRGRYQQEFATLESALLNIEEAKDQAEVLRAFTIANHALAQARALLTPAEIQTQLDRLSQSFEQISIAGELLSEDLSSTGMSVETEERIDRRLESMEAEMLLEKEGVLPPLTTGAEHKTGTSVPTSEKRIDDLLADLEREAKEEREREAES
ncbi:MAG: Snf7 family protein [Candidatus Thorarchaeota archaeon]|nr:Snf7 family protein [Candidatus Thorarchaeota archaeon]